MFGSIKSFFTDIVAPIGITIAAGGNPLPAAAYMGIKTGIETGSPLAGIGSAAFSYGIGSLTRGLTAKPTGGEGIFGLTGTGMSDVGQTIMGETVSGTAANTAALSASGIGGGVMSSGAIPAINQGAFAPIAEGGRGFIRAADLVGTPAAFDTSVLGKVTRIDPSTVIRPPAPSTILGGLIDTTPVPIDPTGLITDKTVNPAYIAAGGLGLQMAATPPEAPAPLTLPPTEERDFSKYDYKGPLDRGEYTYPDPEDLAYGRTSPDSYGYIGAKKGGQIKKFQMGGFSPTDPRMKPVDSRVTSQNVNIMSPPGGIADPTPSANFLATGKIDTVPPGISQLLKTGKPKTKAPKGSPLQTMKMAERAMMPQTPSQPPSMAPQTRGINFSDPNQLASLEKRLGVVPTMPRKDLNININQIRGFLGLAKGGDVPGMAEQPPAGSAGSSSGLGVYSTMPNMTEQQFVDSFLSIMPNNLVGNVVRELGMGEDIGKQMYAQYKDTKNMAQGGEVESNKTLQENAFVIPADVVGHLGDGSSGAGAQKLQSFFGMNPQQYQAGGIMAGELQGPGGGMDDLIQTSIEGKQAAAVSPQEFVVPRDVVAKLGKGSYDQGSKKLYSLMKNVRKVKTGTTKQPNELTLGLNQLMSA
tara:strand:- start:56 stop:1975 length:1920 start_codon:yes stop_codon:yes gene_type:complete